MRTTTFIFIPLLIAIATACVEILPLTDEPEVNEEKTRFASENFEPLAAYYVATNGNDTTGNGSEERPWRTVRYAMEHTPVEGGHEIILKTGTHPSIGYITTQFETPVLLRAETPYKTSLQDSKGHRAGYLSGAKNIIISGFNICGNPHWNDDGLSSWNQNAYLFQIEQCENIILENNIIHDSYNNDILKLNSYSYDCVVRGNIFYNQQPEPGHQHIDANQVYNCVIEDNIFFNDYPASGRNQSINASGFVVVKSSVLRMQIEEGKISLAEATDKGSRQISIARNVFLNWFGRVDQPVILLGEDALPFYEVNDCIVENNLFIHNEVYATKEETLQYEKDHTANRIGATWAIKGVNNVNFRANTITGFIQHGWHSYNNGEGHFGYALRVAIESGKINDIPTVNPPNKDITISNNIFTVPVKSVRGEGQLGIIVGGRKEWLLSGKIDNNLYYNADEPLREETTEAAADALTFSMDIHQIVGNPLLETDLSYGKVITPTWNAGTNRFAGTYTSIEQARIDLINKFGTPSANSPANNAADNSNMPDRDILHNPRGAQRDVGAVEIPEP
ncbi:MAG: hypothetical protein LBQ65_04880 [Tannerellaceae bacterium]|jgi:hypothetical protein|nr:hypothetical protein [Tannerellaceae bacterium]